MGLGFAVTTIIQYANFNFSDLPQSVALQLLNDVYTDIWQYMRLSPETVLQIGLTSNVGQYPLPSSVYLIKEASYNTTTDPQSAVKLWFTSTDFMDLKRPSWRWSNSSSQPEFCYVDADTVNFWPVPNLSTVGVGASASPIVNLYVNQIAALPLTLSDYVSDMISSPEILVYGICKKWASFFHKDQSSYYAGLYALEISRISSFINNVEIRDKPTIQFVMPPVEGC